MPENDRGRSSRRLERALETVAAALNELGVPWAWIGGIAVIARGVRRMTTDIDAVIQGDAATCPDVLRALASHGVCPAAKPTPGSRTSTRWEPPDARAKRAGRT